LHKDEPVSSVLKARGSFYDYRPLDPEGMFSTEAGAELIVRDAAVLAGVCLCTISCLVVVLGFLVRPAILRPILVLFFLSAIFLLVLLHVLGLIALHILILFHIRILVVFLFLGGWFVVVIMTFILRQQWRGRRKQ
jgi:hypothetical protein